MKIFNNPERSEWSEILKRPSQNLLDLESKVVQIFEDVQEGGDNAVKNYTLKYDQVKIEDLKLSEAEINSGASKVPKDLREAINLAKKNIEGFHAAQRTDAVYQETSPGVQCWQEKKPIQKVGLYIPGGTAPLFSTILMLAIPAKLAGCEEIILCSPPGTNGDLPPSVLYTARLCGVTKIFRAGGIQAIAGMTYGTETIPKVYKIFGPGNQFVTAAKQFATRKGVAIDMPAGPSELLVIADSTANPEFVAADLLSQAEHGKDSQVILVSTSIGFLKKVEQKLSLQLSDLPRKEIATAAMENSRFIFIENDEDALELINDYAPEHLIICTQNEEFYSSGIMNVGSVFIGNYTPESAGDYASGTNHTLPTNGYAKNYSGVSLDSFLRTISFQKISEEGLRQIGPAIETMALAEGLEAHKNAVSLRLNNISSRNEE